MKKQIVWVVCEYTVSGLKPHFIDIFTSKELAVQFIKDMEADELGWQYRYQLTEHILWDCMPNKADSIDTYGG